MWIGHISSPHPHGGILPRLHGEGHRGGRLRLCGQGGERAGGASERVPSYGWCLAGKCWDDGIIMAESIGLKIGIIYMGWLWDYMGLLGLWLELYRWNGIIHVIYIYLEYMGSLWDYWDMTGRVGSWNDDL